MKFLTILNIMFLSATLVLASTAKADEPSKIAKQVKEAVINDAEIWKKIKKKVRSESHKFYLAKTQDGTAVPLGAVLSRTDTNDFYNNAITFCNSAMEKIDKYLADINMVGIEVQKKDQVAANTDSLIENLSNAIGGYAMTAFLLNVDEVDAEFIFKNYSMIIKVFRDFKNI